MRWNDPAGRRAMLSIGAVMALVLALTGPVLYLTTDPDLRPAPGVLPSPGPANVIYSNPCPYVEITRDGEITATGRRVVAAETQDRSALETWTSCFYSGDGEAALRWGVVVIGEEFGPDTDVLVDPFALAPNRGGLDPRDSEFVESMIMVRADDLPGVLAALRRTSARIPLVNVDGREFADFEELEAAEADPDQEVYRTDWSPDPEVVGDVVTLFTDDIALSPPGMLTILRIVREELRASGVEGAHVYTTVPEDAM